MSRGTIWPSEVLDWIRANPEKNYYHFREEFPEEDRSHRRFINKKSEILMAAGKEPAVPYMGAKPGAPDIQWDKAERSFHWSDVLAPAMARQEMGRASKHGQDRGKIVVETDRPFPVLFISDWHVGSWGTSYEKVARMTQAIKDLGLRVAILGDMLQMSIKLRNVLEVSDNLLTPSEQIQFLRSWIEEMAPHILWSTWDNHSVMREEQMVGFSTYAELFKDKTIYHSGIGHIDLTVGTQTYKIASAHRFRGNSMLNPTHGQARYMRMEGIDREIAVAGDSHKPAIANYFDGPVERIALNCGSLQADSGYAKRHFSLDTADAMPILLFMPDRHVAIPFMSLDRYLATAEMMEGNKDG